MFRSRVVACLMAWYLWEPLAASFAMPLGYKPCNYGHLPTSQHEVKNCPKRLKSWVETFGMMGCGWCGLGLFRGLQITCQLTALGTWTSIEGITSVIPSTCTGHSWHSYRLLVALPNPREHHHLDQQPLRPEPGRHSACYHLPGI